MSTHSSQAILTPPIWYLFKFIQCISSTWLYNILIVILRNSPCDVWAWDLHSSQMILCHFKATKTFQWAIFAFQTHKKAFSFQLNNKSLQKAQCWHLNWLECLFVKVLLHANKFHNHMGLLHSPVLSTILVNVIMVWLQNYVDSHWCLCLHAAHSFCLQNFSLVNALIISSSNCHAHNIHRNGGFPAFVFVSVNHYDKQHDGGL